MSSLKNTIKWQKRLQVQKQKAINRSNKISANKYNTLIKQYHTLIKGDSTFIFDKVLPGIYLLDSYERKLTDIMIYYSG